MGATKRWLEEEQARGYSSGNNSLICSKHIQDYALHDFIETKGKPGACEYCSERKERNVVTFDQLMEVIVEGIRNHYSHPDDEGVSYTNEFGYWEKTYDTDDLIRWVLELEADDDDIIQEIIDSIGSDDVWCLNSPGYPRESEFLSFDWKFFCKMLKHKVRYVFFKYPKKIKTEYRSADPTNVLDKIGKAVVGLRLFHNTEEELFNNISLYRARQHKRNIKVKSCKDIGPLSLTKANSANRFSPPGIPMFYGAKNKNAAILEVIDKNEAKQIVTTGKFRNIKPLNLIDLTKTPNVSVFDLKRVEFYEAAIFLREFSKNISKKVRKGGTQHFEYVPTQVVTEYFRHVIPYETGIKVDGLIYKSSLAEDEDCYVIFCDSRHCKNEGQQTKQTVLVLENDSIEKLKVRDFKRPRKSKGL